MTETPTLRDPVERLVAQALISAGYEFRYEQSTDPGRTFPAPKLDFYVPSLDLWIECKQRWSSRTERQLHGLENVILVQGVSAARAFAKMIGASL